jgi:hypothetical protein
VKPPLIVITLHSAGLLLVFHFPVRRGVMPGMIDINSWILRLQGLLELPVSAGLKYGRKKQAFNVKVHSQSII